MSERHTSGTPMSGTAELYDGEGRTNIWWRIILLGAVISSILFYASFGSLVYWVVQGLEESVEVLNEPQEPEGLQQELGRLLERVVDPETESGVRHAKMGLGIVILFGIGIFIGTIGFSMIFSNFSYCLFRWNIVIFFLVGVSTFFVMYALLAPEDLKSSLCVSFAATFLVITLKTIIFYFGRWGIVSWS